MVERKIVENFNPERHPDPYEKVRCERRKLKHAIRNVYNQRSSGVISREGLGIAIRDVVFDYIRNHILGLENTGQFEFYPGLFVDSSGNTKCESEDPFLYRNKYDQTEFWIRNKQKVIDRVISCRF